MIDPTKIDINQLPKKFCDGALGTYGKEFFSVVLTSGNSLESFAITPQVMKSISMWMNEQVVNYEKQFSLIEMNYSENPNTIQMSDLNS